MKKNWLLIIMSLVIYLGIIGLSVYFLIMPGVSKIGEANDIKELTYEEKTALIDEINDKYLGLEKDTNDKYAPNIEGINTKYGEEVQGVKAKYDALEVAINQKYDALEQDLTNRINDISVKENKEFFANGLSKKYYELSSQRSALQNEKSGLMLKEREEIRENEKLEEDELRVIEANKINELKTIEANKEAELTRLNESKANEIELINNQNTDKISVRNDGITKLGSGVVIILIPLLYIVLVFNKLTHLSNSVKEKWSQIDVLLKQRSDLLPNIVEVVKGYADHEKSTLTNVTEARNHVISATTKEEEINANKELSGAINRLFFLQEDYPELKANTNFMDLQHSLKTIEDNISSSRKIYNTEVLKYKNKLEMFPSNVIASLFNFKPELFFEIDEDDKDNPEINFE